MHEFIIIVAGGIGKRMGTETPKQFLKINGKTVIEHSIDKFISYNPNIVVIVVIPEDHLDTWNTILASRKDWKNIQTTSGGKERFHSVQNGLSLIKESEFLVGVHDAARPFVSEDLIERCYRKSELKGAVVPLLPVTDSLRKMKGNMTHSVNRKDYWIVQTPQCFQGHILKTAYRQDFHEDFTDDASVVENSGSSVSMVEGEKSNFKITTKEDLTFLK